ncbi:MAG: hypothetical protein ACK4IY_01035 [Chitinophagales bacterium]
MKGKFLIAFIFITTAVSAADSLLYTVHLPCSFFTTDHLQNLYYISPENEVVKYDFSTGRTYTYSDKRLGKPTYIDASNPMKVLVFYADFYTLVILDNKCTAISVLNLTLTIDRSSYLPLVVCAEAEADYYWIYDQLSRRLIKLDERGNKVLESEPFDALFNEVVLPAQLVYENQTIYLIDKNYRILLFDLFGTYMHAIITQSSGWLQIVNKNFVFTLNNDLVMVDHTLLKRNNYKLPLTGVLQVRIHPNKLFVRTADQIAVYSANY